MTPRQKQQFNGMKHALKTIAHCMTAEQMKAKCKDSFGIGYTESLEYSYNNIQETAKRASKGVREAK